MSDARSALGARRPLGGSARASTLIVARARRTRCVIVARARAWTRSDARCLVVTPHAHGRRARRVRRVEARAMRPRDINRPSRASRRTRDVRPGDRVGANERYLVCEMINRGGTATVYRGLDRERGDEEVALKVIDSGEGARVRVPLSAVKREVKYATKLMMRDEMAGRDNAGVVRLLNVVNHGEDVLVLVFELAKGIDALDYVNQQGGRLDEAEARRLFAQLVSAVRTIHDNGFCHRDIKPENAIVCADGNLRLIDFGLAKGLESANTRAVGTPDYMSPELLDKVDATGKVRTERYDAAACDVWSSGVFLFIILTGSYPFQDSTRPNNVKATLQNIVKGNVAPMRVEVSDAVRDLIARMLEPDPRKRITLKEIMNHPWLMTSSEASPPRRKKLGVIDRLKSTFRRMTS